MWSKGWHPKWRFTKRKGRGLKVMIERQRKKKQEKEEKDRLNEGNDGKAIKGIQTN